MPELIKASPNRFDSNSIPAVVSCQGDQASPGLVVIVDQAQEFLRVMVGEQFG